jgi:hypothetical protein
MTCILVWPAISILSDYYNIVAYLEHVDWVHDRVFLRRAVS